MKNYKSQFFLFIILVMLGCSNNSVNKYQVNSSLENMDCYKRLITEIKNNPELSNKLLEIRDSKKRGKFDPIKVAQEYRLIELLEIEEMLQTGLTSDCISRLKQSEDIRGIRYVTEDIMIIEIDQVDRHTIIEQYSRDKTKELHRLIVSPKDVDYQKFYYGSEYRVWGEEIAEGIKYEVSHLKTQ